jgi:two-component system, sensor histidine kinase PdtaS
LSFAQTNHEYVFQATMKYQSHHNQKITFLPVIIIFLLTVSVFTYAQTPGQEQLGTLENIHSKALYYFKNGDIARGKMLFTEVIDKISKRGNEQTEVDLWYELALLIPSRDTTGITRMFCFEQMIALYKRTGNEEKEIKVLQDIADMHMTHGKYLLAENELINVIQRYEKINHLVSPFTYNLLAATHSKRGDFAGGLSYGLKAVESMEVTHDSSSALNFYSHLGHMYSELGQPEKSAEWYWKLFETRKFSDEDNMYSFRDAGLLARELIKLRKENEALTFILDIETRNKPDGAHAQASLLASLAYCYLHMNRDQPAEKYYTELTKLTSQLKKNNEITTEVNYELGQYFLGKQQYAKASNYLQHALNASAGINTLSVTKNIYLMLYRSDSATGNYLSAIQHLMKHKALNDSIFNETKSRQIEELQVQYETAEKEQNIKLLNNQNQLQRNSVEQANKTRNITLAFVALLLIIVGLLFNRYTIKQRSNHKLELNQKELDKKNSSLEALNADQHKLLQEKEWLIKEVHHRVKNNLEIIMSLLNSQSKYIDNDAALMAINDSQRRVQAISLIHQKLYQSENTSSIAMRQYIDELVTYLDDSFDTVGRSIIIEQDIEPLKLDVAKAIPVGLIINESIVNAVKYAFPDGTRGIVRITLKADDSDDHLVLTISDNGIGLPPTMEVSNHDSLGFSLMSGLTRQLDGNFNMKSYNGLHISIRFSASNNQLYD